MKLNFKSGNRTHGMKYLVTTYLIVLSSVFGMIVLEYGPKSNNLFHNLLELELHLGLKNVLKTINNRELANLVFL